MNQSNYHRRVSSFHRYVVRFTISCLSCCIYSQHAQARGVSHNVSVRHVETHFAITPKDWDIWGSQFAYVLQRDREVRLERVGTNFLVRNESKCDPIHGADRPRFADEETILVLRYGGMELIALSTCNPTSAINLDGVGIVGDIDLDEAHNDVWFHAIGEHIDDAIAHMYVASFKELTLKDIGVGYYPRFLQHGRLAFVDPERDLALCIRTLDKVDGKEKADKVLATGPVGRIVKLHDSRGYVVQRGVRSGPARIDG